MPTPTFLDPLADDDNFDSYNDGLEGEESPESPERSRLLEYSDLSHEGVAAFRQSWLTLPDEERVSLVVALVEFAEASIHVNFNRAFREMLSDPLPRVRQMAIEGLWEDEGVDLLPGFLDLFANDPNVDVRAEAATALLRFIEEPGSMGEDGGEAILVSLLAVIGNTRENALVRRRAIEAAGLFVEDRRVSQMLREAYRDDDQAIAAGAIGAMGYSRQSKWLPEIESAMRHEDAEMRYVAAIAAGAIGDPDAVQSLATLVDDEDGEVRYAAIAALGQIGGRGALRVLTNLQEREDSVDELVEAAIEEARLVTDPLNDE